MKVLLPMGSSVQKLCGLAEREEGVAYRPTKHMVAAECPDGLRLYHTLTGELVLLENGETPETLSDEMIAHRFWVPEDFDERRYVNETRALLKLVYRNRTKKHFTILTTTDCNARCFYCYEMGVRRVPMSPEVALAVTEYMLRCAKGEKLKLRWFGGEPLYNIEAIRLICRTLTERGASFSSSMISNGLLLTPEVAEEAVRDWRLGHVQITLDGTEAVYNRIKAYVNGGDNPFMTVLSHIRGCLDAGIRVSIRLNVDPDNVKDQLALCDDLIERFGVHPNLSVYAAAIRNFRKDRYTEDEERALQDSTTAVLDKLRAAGMRRIGKLSNKFHVNACMGDDPGSEVILPDGRIGKCEHFSDRELVGSIFEQQQDSAMLRAWGEQTPEVPACADCPLYPNCIRLNKCVWTHYGCPEGERERKLRDLIDRIRTFVPGDAPGEDERTARDE